MEIPQGSAAASPQGTGLQWGLCLLTQLEGSHSSSQGSCIPVLHLHSISRTRRALTAGLCAGRDVPVN